MFKQIQFAAVLLLASSAHADVRTDQERGVEVVRFSVAGRADEICVRPKHRDESVYSDFDRDEERALCQYNIGQNAAACAKVNSTNPGLNFYRTPMGVSADALAARNCAVKGAKLDAKYKSSTSCSYTPSILGYYHLSRVLGGRLHVPVAVMRTFDLERHRAIATATLPTLPKSSLIFKTWETLLSVLDNGRTHPKAEKVLLADVDQTYGALQRNPRSEVFYGDFYTEGANKVEAFRDRNPIFQKLRAEEFDIDAKWSRGNVQAFVQLRDMADMLVIDMVMSQQDRLKNTHAVEVWYSRAANGEVLRSDRLMPGSVGPSFRVRELMLKDNDCGVAKVNRFKDAGLLSELRHLDPETYRRLLRFAQDVEASPLEAFFKDELLFTDADFKRLRRNVAEISQSLRSACEQGRLKLDLDLDAHFGAKAKSVTCDL